MDTSRLLDRLSSIIGSEHVLTDADPARYLDDRRGLYHGRALAVVQPGSTDEVSALVRLAAEEGIPIVPQGGNTSLVGGAVPDESGRALLVSLVRMDAVRALDPDGNTMIVEAGATLAQVRRAAASVGRHFPLSLAPEERCTIGGNLGTNAGGLAVLAFGSMRDLTLGLEVVLPDGRVWNGLRTLRKDNTGYDLKNLFIGAEGTLGIITAAALKLFPRLTAQATAFAGVGSVEAALALFQRARAAAGPSLTAAEFLPRFGLELAVRLSGAPDPLDEPYPYYVLLELSSSVDQGVRALLDAVLEDAKAVGEVQEAVLASRPAERKALWILRESMSDAQKLAGASIKHDVSVPVADVPAFIAEANVVAHSVVPGCRPVPFGHLGDGNVHFNITQPDGADPIGYLGRWSEMNDAIHAVAARFNGSIAAEHGVGRLKRDLLPGVKDPVELDLMRAVKTMLDPQGLMNPGAVLPETAGGSMPAA
ncbi:FAD-binding oxidoreductase [Terrihabitans sp. B22-R8]|uniref:FAD-binding oxidoreductase n=1 Tax=Terrihabitans sp. B22-R8 TaxID=3425128 RepID=UPI00403C8ABD